MCERWDVYDWFDWIYWCETIGWQCRCEFTLTGPLNLFPTAVHSHMYSKLCGIFWHNNSHTKKTKTSYTSIYLGYMYSTNSKAFNHQFNTVSHCKESNVSRDGWFWLFHWGSGLGRYQPCGHFGQRLTTTGPSLEWTARLAGLIGNVFSERRMCFFWLETLYTDWRMVLMNDVFWWFMHSGNQENKHKKRVFESLASVETPSDFWGASPQLAPTVQRRFCYLYCTSFAKCKPLSDITYIKLGFVCYKRQGIVMGFDWRPYAIEIQQKISEE